MAFIVAWQTYLFVFRIEITTFTILFMWLREVVTLTGWRRDRHQVKCRRHGWPHCFSGLFNWTNSFSLSCIYRAFRLRTYCTFCPSEFHDLWFLNNCVF
jgi:hypothetical protein